MVQARGDPARRGCRDGPRRRMVRAHAGRRGRGGCHMQLPAPFEYERASSLDDAIALLERHGPDARLIAGGHSLLPMMKLRLARPEVLIDVNDLTDLAGISI